MAERTQIVNFRGGNSVRALSDRLDDLGPALHGAGAYLVSQVQRAFREQRRGSHEWPERMSPNVPGIVSDLNRGAAILQRRFEARPALSDTGRLRQSISYRISGKDQVYVGSSVTYADVHHFGKLTQHRLTPAGRGRLAELLRRRPELRPDLGWLFHTPAFDVRVRARPFLAVTDDDRRVVQEIVEDYLAEIDAEDNGEGE